MRYQYIIVDLIDDTVKGTNNAEEAREYAEDENFFVIDVSNGVWLVEGGKVNVIDEAGPYDG